MKSTLTNMVLSLGILTALAGAALASVNLLTREPIARAAEATRTAATEAVLGDVPGAVAIEAASDNGFSGRIVVLFGFAPDGTLTGFRVLEHAETPGLGAKMGTWFATAPHSVIGTRHPLAVTKDGGDVDAITGATITSRAFLEALNNARAQFQNAKQQQP